jgi:epimerase transport system membrane fusion protein
MTIVPDNDRLMIHVQLSPMDIDRLSIGQDAEVRFAVFKDAYTISGRLVNLSADTIVDEISGQPFYEGKVMLEEADIGLLGDERLVPGMPAEVLIKTGTRTLLSYLVSPLSRMFEASLTED